jgi:hypothetical protein
MSGRLDDVLQRDYRWVNHTAVAMRAAPTTYIHPRIVPKFWLLIFIAGTSQKV